MPQVKDSWELVADTWVRENDFKAGVSSLSTFVSSTDRWHDFGFRGAHPLSCVNIDSLFFFKTRPEHTREHARGQGCSQINRMLGYQIGRVISMRQCLKNTGRWFILFGYTSNFL